MNGDMALVIKAGTMSANRIADEEVGLQMTMVLFPLSCSVSVSWKFGLSRSWAADNMMT